MKEKTGYSLFAFMLTVIFASPVDGQTMNNNEFDRIMGNAGINRVNHSNVRPTSVPLFVAFHSGAFGTVPMTIDYNLTRDYRIWTTFYKPHPWEE